MTPFTALRDGIRRVRSAPALLMGVFATTIVVAVPLSLTLRGTIHAHLGDSLEAERAASGVNLEWWQEFSAQASGAATTFSPSIIGFGAVLTNISDLADNDELPREIVGTATAYVLIWIFLIGGVLDRYARRRSIGAAAFFAASGVYFFRFLRLAVVAWIGYYVLFGRVHGWLFDRVLRWITRDVTVEWVVFLWRAAFYIMFAGALIVWNVVFDYAKIRAVVEDRRSMVGALLAGARFVRRNAAKVFGLYLMDAAIFLMVLVVYAILAPGAGTTGGSMWWGWIVAQIYVIARLWVKLLFYASQTALFQGELAHASYIAAPAPIWPDSPTAEAIAGAAPSGDPMERRVTGHTDTG